MLLWCPHVNSNERKSKIYVSGISSANNFWPVRASDVGPLAHEQKLSAHKQGGWNEWNKILSK